MTDTYPDPGRRKPPDHLTDENGKPTAVRADMVSKGDPAELLRGVGQENITARPAIRRASDPDVPLPPLDDDATQMKKVEDAAGTAPSPEGVAEPRDARTPPIPPITSPD